MTKPASWQTRRWKLFLHEYDHNADFKQELHKRYDFYKTSKEDGRLIIRQLLFQYRIPTHCLDSVIMFLENPNLKESKYTEVIKPPILFAEDINFEDMDIWLPNTTGTLLFVQPFVKKSELKELIDEYWHRFENYKPNPERDKYSSSLRLKDKIRPTQSRSHAKRDELIKKLYKEGNGDVYIAMELKDKNLADKNINANRVKQIRFRLGLTKKRKS